MKDFNQCLEDLNEVTRQVRIPDIVEVKTIIIIVSKNY
jgi:hypothetical protein